MAGSFTMIFVRHGETPQHAENRYVGVSDVPLTETGQAQAGALAEWAATAELTGIASSPLSRATSTAAPVAEATGLEVRVDDRLRELDFGRAELMTSAEMRAEFPQARKAFEADSYRNPLPGGESPKTATERVRAAAEDYARGTLGDRVIVVAHGTLLRLLVCDLFGIDPGRYRGVFPDVHNTSGAVLRSSPSRGWGLLAWNPPLVAAADPWL